MHPQGGWGLGRCWPWDPAGRSQPAFTSQKLESIAMSPGRASITPINSGLRQACRRQVFPGGCLWHPLWRSSALPGGCGFVSAALCPEICLDSPCPGLQPFPNCLLREARYYQWGFFSGVSPNWKLLNSNAIDFCCSFSFYSVMNWSGLVSKLLLSLSRCLLSLSLSLNPGLQ